jgi:hypothetical protein
MSKFKKIIDAWDKEYPDDRLDEQDGILYANWQATLLLEEHNDQSFSLSFDMDANPIFVANFIKILIKADIPYQIYESYTFDEESESIIFESDLEFMNHREISSTVH